MDTARALLAARSDARTIRPQLDAVLIESLRPFVLGSAICILLGAIYISVLLPRPLNFLGFALGIALSIGYAKVYQALHQHRIPDHFAHPLAASVTGAGYLLLAFSLFADRDAPGDLRFMALALTIVMASALYLTLRWLTSVMAVFFGAWIAINIATGYDFDWMRHLSGLLFIAITTFISYAVRKRAIVRMIEMQHENERQYNQLTDALERAHRSEAELHVERYMADQIVDTMGQGLVLLNDSGEVEYTNNAAEEIFGHTMFELTGVPVGTLLRGKDGAPLPQALTAGGPLAEEEQSFEALVAQHDGDDAHLLVSTVARPGGGMIVTLTDLTFRKQFEARLERLAKFDALTGLANRTNLIDTIESAAEGQAEEQRNIAVLFLDLDRFKQINDTFGHAVGDRVLIECAERIQQCIRAQDTAARFGGDEFVIFIDGVVDSGAAVEIAERIVARIEEPFVLPDSIQHLSGSVGIHFGEARATGSEEMIQQADAAMYEAKRDKLISTVVYGSGRPERASMVA